MSALSFVIMSSLILERRQVLQERKSLRQHVFLIFVDCLDYV